MYIDKEAQRKCWREWYRRNKNRVRREAQGRREQRAEWFRKLKRTLKCKKCGESHPATLHFHHLDKSKKEFEVSVIVHRGWSIKRIEEEMAKCVVFCANCHAKLHYKEKMHR